MICIALNFKKLIIRTEKVENIDDRDEYFGFRLLFYNNEGQLLKVYNSTVADSLKMGRGFNGHEKYIALGPFPIELRADVVQAKLIKSGQTGGEDEPSDTIQGNVSYQLDITYGARAEPNILTGSPV